MFSIPRILAISTNVFREVMRERVLYITGFYGFSLMLAVILLNEVSAGSEGKISLDVALAGMSLLGLAVTAFIGAGLMNKEIEKKTALVLVAKPISRVELIVGKHLGLSSVIGVLLFIMLLMTFAIMTWRQIPFAWTSLSISTVFLLLELSLIAAIALLFGICTSSLIATIFTIAAYLIGHFSKNLITLKATIETESVQNLITGIYLVFPDLSRLDLKNQAVYDLLPDSATLALDASYGLLYILLILGIGSLIFTYREF